MIDDRNASVRSIIDGRLHAIGQSVATAWPIDRAAKFDELLKAIEEAERELGTRRGGGVEFPNP